MSDEPDIEESITDEDEDEDMVYAAIDQPFVSDLERYEQYINDEEIAACMQEATDMAEHGPSSTGTTASAAADH